MGIVQNVRRAVAWAVVLTLALTTAPLLAAESPLGQASADAPVVVVVPSLAKLSQKLAMMNDAMGLNVPQLGDALGMFKQQMGITKGLRDDGAMVLTVTSADGMFGGDEPPMVLLMAVTDYAEFVSNYGGDGAQAVTQVNIPGGRPAFAKKLDGYAVMGPKQEVVAAYKPAGAAAALTAAAGKLGRGYLDTSDAYVYINWAVLGPKVQPKIQEAYAQGVKQIDAHPQPMAPLAKAMMKMYADSVSAVVRDGTASVMGLDITELGLGMSGTMQFKAGSYLAGVFTNGSEAAGQLNKLPSQNYMFASAMSLQGVAVKTLVDELTARLPKDGGDVFTTMIGKALPLLTTMKAVSQVYYVPPQGGGVGGLGSSLLNGVSVVETTDAKAYMQGYKDYITSLNNLKIAAPVAPGAPGAAPNAQAEAPAMSITTNYTPNALQIDGVNVDQFQVQYNLPPEVMQQMGQIGPMLSMLGGTGQSGYIATVDNRVLMTTTLNTDLVRQTLASLKADTGLGSQQTLQQVRQSLPPKPMMESFISLGGIFTTVNQFMAMMGGQPIQVPADLPPIGAGVSLQESGVASRLFVPTPVVRFLKDNVGPVVGGMMGGGGGQQPPPGGPQPAPF